MPRGLVPDRVRHRVRPVAQPGYGLGQRQRGTLGVAEVGHLPPRRHREQALFRLARLLLREARHVDADAAAVIWLARRWARPSVRGGTPAFSVAAASVCSACRASGTIIAGFFIRACMVLSYQVSVLTVSH